MSHDCFCFVWRLVLEWNALGMWEEGFAIFCEGLASNTTLTHLDLRNNQINHQGSAELCVALKRNTTLQELGKFCIISVNAWNKFHCCAQTEAWLLCNPVMWAWCHVNVLQNTSQTPLNLVFATIRCCNACNVICHLYIFIVIFFVWFRHGSSCLLEWFVCVCRSQVE